MQGLYLVTPNWDSTERLLTVTEQALQAAQGCQPGIALLQYRHKHASPALRLEQATALRRLCRQYGVPFIVNDFVELARQVEADGVHLGASDAALAAVRAELGPAAIIGASCYGDMALALAAQAAGASYVAFGGLPIARETVCRHHGAGHTGSSAAAHPFAAGSNWRDDAGTGRAAGRPRRPHGGRHQQRVSGSGQWCRGGRRCRTRCGRTAAGAAAVHSAVDGFLQLFQPAAVV
jgi:thiamine-phosphate diphosphorylase